MKSITQTALAVLVVLVVAGCGGEENPYNSAISSLVVGLAVAGFLMASILRYLRQKNNRQDSGNGAGITTLLVLSLLPLAGCGGSGTGFENGGGGGGGGERIAASYTGVTDTEYGSGQNASRGALGQPFFPGNGELITKVSFMPWLLGQPAGRYVVDIRPDNNGVPGETVLATSNPVDSASSPTTAATAARQDWIFPLVSQCRTVIGVRYWPVARRLDNIGGCLVFKAKTDPNGGLLSQHAESGVWQGLGSTAWHIIWTRP